LEERYYDSFPEDTFVEVSRRHFRWGSSWGRDDGANVEGMRWTLLTSHVPLWHVYCYLKPLEAEPVVCLIFNLFTQSTAATLS